MAQCMVIGLMVGRGRHPLTLPSPLLPPAKEFLLLQFLISRAVLSKTPRVEEWLLTLSAHGCGFFQRRFLSPLVSGIPLKNRAPTYNSLPKYQPGPPVYTKPAKTSKVTDAQQRSEQRQAHPEAQQPVLLSIEEASVLAHHPSHGPARWSYAQL